MTSDKDSHDSSTKNATRSGALDFTLYIVIYESANGEVGVKETLSTPQRATEHTLAAIGGSGEPQYRCRQKRRTECSIFGSPRGDFQLAGYGQEDL